MKKTIAEGTLSLDDALLRGREDDLASVCAAVKSRFEKAYPELSVIILKEGSFQIQIDDSKDITELSDEVMLFMQKCVHHAIGEMVETRKDVPSVDDLNKLFG